MDSKTTYKNLFEYSNDAILITDPVTRKILDANVGATDLLGYSRQELIGMTSKDILMPLPPGRNAEIANTLSQTGRVIFQHYYRTKDGTAVPVEISSRAVEANGDTYYQCSVRDISQRKEAEALLLRQRDRAQRYLDIANVILLVVDAEQMVTLINKKGCDVLGYDERDIVGKNWFDHFLPSRLRPTVKEVFDRLIAGDITPVEHFENQVLTKSGEERNIAWHNSVLTDAEGNITGILSSGTDVTEELRTQQALTESEKQYRFLTQFASDAIISATGEGMIATWNRAAETIFGYRQEEAVGQPLTMLMPERYREKHMQGIARADKADRHTLIGKTVEFAGLRKNGTEFPLELSVAMWSTEKGLFFSAIIRDVTERKKLRQQLIHSEKLSTIGTFVTGVAHELNNPLTAILGFSQILMQYEDLSDEVKHDLNLIGEQSHRTMNIVKNLLKYSRKHEPGKSYVSVNDVIEDTLTLQSYRFKSDNIKIQKRLELNLPMVVADVNHLQQVFLNIALNAHQAMIQAHKKGVLTVTTCRQNGDVQVLFENDGPPIPARNLGKLFDPFFTTKEVGEGTGLGLYVAYGLVEEHGGAIRAENIGTSGVRFCVTLPSAGDKSPVGSLPVSGRIPGNMKEITVLFADDEESIRKWIVHIMKERDIDLHLATNGAEAVALMEKQEFDVIVSDIKMPVMSGYEVGEWLSAHRPEYLPRFVLLTGAIDDAVDDFCNRHGCSYLIKPIGGDKLLSVLSDIAGVPRRTSP